MANVMSGPAALAPSPFTAPCGPAGSDRGGYLDDAGVML